MSFRSPAVVALVGLCAPLALAGDLNPPGAPDSTLGPEPRTAINQANTPGDDTAIFRITEPGSYYLEGNTVVHNNSLRHGIMVLASDVTIDLNGFTLDGLDVLDPSPNQISIAPVSGIQASGGFQNNITVRNGVVRDWGLDGISLIDTRNSLVEGVHAWDNGRDGIKCNSTSIVMQCVARENGEDGIQVGSTCSVIDCIAEDNENDGIIVGQGGSVRGCVVRDNGKDGISVNDGQIIECTSLFNGRYGLSASGLVRHCVANHNTDAGIRIASGIALENVCHFNDEAGILVPGANVRVEGNALHGNARGIEVTISGNLIVRNRATHGSQDHYGSIVGGNDVGTIQSSPVNAGPWDNFSP